MLLKINFCKECEKPLYVYNNIEIFGFDTKLYCRNNLHFYTMEKRIEVKGK
jgi:RNase P subunit RPR2